MTKDPLEILVKQTSFIEDLRSRGLVLTRLYKPTKRGLSRSKYRIVHAGHVVTKKFHTWAQASLWADENYKSKRNVGGRRALWKIIEI